MEMLIRMGFYLAWVATIMKCITTISYSVIVNENASEVFRSTRELRQGDPLSPFLFLICSEGLPTLMRLAMRYKLIRRAKASRSDPSNFSFIIYQ